MRSNDNLIIQIAIAMIIIALLGIVIIRASDRSSTVRPLPQATAPIAVKVQQGAQLDTNTAVGNDIDQLVANNSAGNNVQVIPRLVENINSDQANLVKQYFAGLESRNFAQACDVLSNDKCRASNSGSVELFSREYNKLVNGYEYTSIKDLGFTSPSGKDVVCVKYSYRYKEDLDPRLISEIMSFYVATEGGQLKITDRVCEKKYKEGSGNRPCPIEPNARYCVGNVK